MSAGGPETLPSDPHAVVIDSGAHALAGRLELPRPGVSSLQPVLICPPWGWADVASYRARWAWSRQLAERGHPCLRVDLPTTGNSSGNPRGHGTVEAWVHGVTAASAWLCDTAGTDGVAAIGLGLGGLLAATAAADGAPIHELALWNAPADGRRFTREMRALALLSGLQSDGPATRTGDLYASGFLLTADTLRALSRLRLDDAGTAALLRRVLLLDANPDDAGDGSTSTGVALAQTLRTADIEVTRGPGPGYASFTDHPERPTLPPQTVDSVERWLAAGTVTPAPRVAQHPGPARVLEPDPAVRERAVLLADDHHGTPGTLATPVSGDLRCGPIVVFLNAGAVRQTGPNRLWVEAARRFATRGTTSIRVDLDGIGDAGAGGAEAWATADFYAPSIVRQVLRILDGLQTAEVGDRFLLVGLCAGASAAIVAAADPRVVGVVAINPGAIVYDDAVHARRARAEVRRMRSPALWARAVRGDLDGARVAAVMRALAHRPRIARRGESADRLTRLLRPLTDGHADIAVAFSGDEPLLAEIERDGTLARLEAVPGLVVSALPGTDHTLRSPEAQAAAHDLLRRQLTQTSR